MLTLPKAPAQHTVTHMHTHLLTHTLTLTPSSLTDFCSSCSSQRTSSHHPMVLGSSPGSVSVTLPFSKLWLLHFKKAFCLEILWIHRVVRSASVLSDGCGQTGPRARSTE